MGELNGFSYSEGRNNRLGTGVIEWTCDNGKLYAVDVTNAKNEVTVEAKWNNREYYKHADEVWIIVVANKWDPKKYKKWNKDSPDNVLVIDYRKIEQFLNGLNSGKVIFNIPEEKKRKLRAFAECTFWNKEKIKEKYDLKKETKELKDFF